MTLSLRKESKMTVAYWIRLILLKGRISLGVLDLVGRRSCMLIMRDL